MAVAGKYGMTTKIHPEGGEVAAEEDGPPVSFPRRHFAPARASDPRPPRPAQLAEKAFGLVKGHPLRKAARLPGGNRGRGFAKTQSIQCL